MLTSLSRRRLSELAHRAKDLTDAQLRVSRAQARLDATIHAAVREAGDGNITAIALAAGVSRPTVYKAIERHEATIRPKLPLG